MFTSETLPCEVLEEIFIRLDGVSLAKCRQVCRTWNEIILNMHSVYDVWKRCCFREISTDVLRQLCGEKEIVRFQSQEMIPIIDWLSKYKIWINGRCVKMKDKRPESLAIENRYSRIIYSPVTCLKVSGTVVITGHRDGNIQLWDAHQGNMIHTITKHFKMVTCLALVDLLYEGCYRINEDHESQHHHVCSVSRDHILQISPLSCDNCEEHKNSFLFHNDVLDTVKVFGSKCLVHCMDGIISLWQMKPPANSSSIIKATLLLLLRSPFRNFVTINFWQEKIFCLNGMREFYNYDPVNYRWERLHTALELIWPERTTQRLKSSSSCAFMLRSFYFLRSLLFVTSLEGLLLVSVNGQDFRVHSPMRTLQSPILSVCFWGSILALGAESGALFLYHIPDIEKISELNLNNYDWTYHLSEASIIDVDIFDDGTGPLIAAASNEEIFIIRWKQETC